MALSHPSPNEIVSLSPLGENLGRAATRALVKTDQFEAVRMIMRKGSSVATHQVQGYVTLHCLEGSVSVEMAEPVEMTADDWLYLDKGMPHGLRALTDCSVLMTIMFGTAR